MKRRAIIHGFHSQVCQTLAELDDEPDVIVALDSHLDVYMGVKEVLVLMPEDVQLAAIRASAHTMIRRVLGDLPLMYKIEGLPSFIDLLPEMLFVVPQVSLDTQLFERAQFPLALARYASKQAEPKRRDQRHHSRVNPQFWQRFSTF